MLPFPRAVPLVATGTTSLFTSARDNSWSSMIIPVSEQSMRGSAEWYELTCGGTSRTVLFSWKQAVLCSLASSSPLRKPFSASETADDTTKSGKLMHYRGLQKSWPSRVYLNHLGINIYISHVPRRHPTFNLMCPLLHLYLVVFLTHSAVFLELVGLVKNMAGEQQQQQQQQENPAIIEVDSAVRSVFVISTVMVRNPTHKIYRANRSVSMMMKLSSTGGCA